MESKTTTPIPYAEPHTIHLAATDAPTLDVVVQFADQASRVFRVYRDKYGFGASGMDWGCGQISNSKGQIVGRISYNGRIWDTDGNVME